MMRPIPRCFANSCVGLLHIKHPCCNPISLRTPTKTHWPPVSKQENHWLTTRPVHHQPKTSPELSSLAPLSFMDTHARWSNIVSLWQLETLSTTTLTTIGAFFSCPFCKEGVNGMMSLKQLISNRNMCLWRGTPLKSDQIKSASGPGYLKQEVETMLKLCLQKSAH